MASSCTYYEPNCGSTSLCNQNCGVQPADRHTDTWTDKSLKTEGPKILLNDIFYFRTVIIGGPILLTKKKHHQRKFSSHFKENSLHTSKKILFTLKRKFSSEFKRKNFCRLQIEFSAGFKEIFLWASNKFLQASKNFFCRLQRNFLQASKQCYLI